MAATTLVLKPVPALANSKTIVLAVPSTNNLARDEVMAVAIGAANEQSNSPVIASHCAYEGG